MHPHHPLYGVDRAHISFTPYGLLGALIARATGWSVITVLSVLAMFNLMIVLAGFTAFVRLLFRREGTVFWALLAVLLLWGPRPWRFSGFLDLNAIGFVLPYPSMFAMGVAFVVLAVHLRWLRGTGPRWTPLVVALLAAVVVTSHVVTGSFLGIALVALTAGERDRVPPHALGTVCLTLVAAGVLTLAWPYYSIVGALTSSNRDFAAQNRTMYESVVPRLFPALLALPIVFSRARRDWRDPLATMLPAFGAIYVFGWVTQRWSVGRIVLFVALVLQLAAADWAAGLEERVKGGGSARMRSGGLAVLGMVALAAAVNMSPGLVRAVPGFLRLGSLRTDPRLAKVSATFGPLARVVPRDDVVIADVSSAVFVPAFAGKVVFARSQLFVDDSNRRDDVRRFFSSRTSQSQRRQVVRRYHARWVLWDVRRGGVDTATAARVERLGDVAYRSRQLVVVRLARAPRVQVSPATNGAHGGTRMHPRTLSRARGAPRSDQPARGTRIGEPRQQDSGRSASG